MYAFEKSPTLAPAFHEWLVKRDVVLVAGPYKTGTSLAMQIIAEAGFVDPSIKTNPSERAYGLSRPRYWTRECQILRNLNESLLIPQAGTLNSFMRAKLEGYLRDWGLPLVLKDPRFAFTLPHWIQAAQRTGLSVGVLFTYRPFEELIQAWEAAPFTQTLLRLDGILKFSQGQASQWEWCSSNDIPRFSLSLAQLRYLNLLQLSHSTQRQHN